MKLARILLALALVVTVGATAYVAQQAEPAGVAMSSAAEQFLGSLKPEQKTKATFPFDSKERTNWHFIPLQDKNKKSTRKGLPLEEMTDQQKKAAVALVAAGTSAKGKEQALTIMSLESILHDLEKNGAMVRDPQWYFFTVFGTPSKTGKWGWRVEGHHLSLNFTVEGGQVVSSTPAFFGANPATVMAGPKKGLRTLPKSDDLARELFESLDEAQKKAAYRDKPFPEPKAKSTTADVGAPTGLAAAKMNEKQRGILMDLVQAYTARMPAAIGQEQFKQVRATGVDKIYFAYTFPSKGEAEAGVGHTYRVQGPTFVIEFLNMQADSAGNPANHIHSCWRDLKGDFGLATQ